MYLSQSTIDDFLNFKHHSNAEAIHKPYIKENLQNHEQNIQNRNKQLSKTLQTKPKVNYGSGISNLKTEFENKVSLIVHKN